MDATAPANSFVTHPQQGVPLQELESHHSLWNTFEHILMFISLLVMAFFGTWLLNIFVDHWSPGINNSLPIIYQASYIKTLVRACMAALIVSYPLFAFFFLHTKKRLAEYPALASSKSRKVLIYMTLIVTFLIMLANIIVAIFNLLNGDVSLNLLLHLFVTLAVNAIIFGYYLGEMKYGH